MMAAGVPVRLPVLLKAVVSARSSALGALVVMAALLQVPQGPSRRVQLDDDESPSLRSTERREFHFTRAIYSGFGFGGYGRRSSWATDYPKADRQFLMGVRRLLTHLDLSGEDNAIPLDDPELRRYPFLYAVEVGRMSLSDTEVEGLRNYLLAGGFLVVDDFWGSDQWEQFEGEMRRVLPGCRIVDLPPDHPLLSAFYDVKEMLQVPNIGNAMRGQTSERDGYTPVPARHLRRQGPPDGRDQREHRPRRRLGVGGAAGVPAEVLDLRVPDGRQLHRLRDEPLGSTAHPDALDFESVFELLFKYRAVRLREGAVRHRLGLAGGGRPAAGRGGRRLELLAGARSARAAPTAWSWPWPRTAALAVVAFCLCRPGLVLQTAVPQQSFVGVLLDDSRSMRIADGGQAARATS